MADNSYISEVIGVGLVASLESPLNSVCKLSRFDIGGLARDTFLKVGSIAVKEIGRRVRRRELLGSYIMPGPNISIRKLTCIEYSEATFFDDRQVEIRYGSVSLITACFKVDGYYRSEYLASRVRLGEHLNLLDLHIGFFDAILGDYAWCEELR